MGSQSDKLVQIPAQDGANLAEERRRISRQRVIDPIQKSGEVTGHQDSKDERSKESGARLQEETRLHHRGILQVCCRVQDKKQEQLATQRSQPRYPIGET